MKLEEKRGDIKLTALCDVDESRFNKEIATNLGGDTSPMDLSKYNLYTDINEMLEKEELDFVITAVPTYIHEEIAVLALEKGLHVFSEKPMALTLEQCKKMIDKAEEKSRFLMIGQCLRFWPEYVKLKELIDSKKYGDVIRAEFSRYANTPVWTWQNWMMNHEKSGGAALDMHVHDVDFINWVFGKPTAVSSVATHVKCKFDSIITTYKYDDFLVTAACDWGLADKFPFSPGFLVRFEKSTVIMNSSGMKVFTDDEVFTVDTAEGDAYTNEINEFIDCINQSRSSLVTSPESVMQSLKIALAEKESAIKGKVIKID